MATAVAEFRHLEECTKPLMNPGCLDPLLDLSRRALEFASPGSIEEAALKGNLGVIYQMRGDLRQDGERIL